MDVIPEEILKVSRDLMSTYLQRLQLVVRLMIRLRPDLIKHRGLDKILGIDIEPYYQALVKIQAEADDLKFMFEGVWNNEWRWRLHGIGCKVTNARTGENFDWDANHPYDLNGFWQHLEWRIANETDDANVSVFLRWQVDNNLGPVVTEVMEPHYWITTWPARERIEKHMLQKGILLQQQIDTEVFLLPQSFVEGRVR